MALSSQPVEIDWQQDALWHGHPMENGLISRHPRANMSMPSITDKHIIDWYFQVDSHGRIEGLLPSHVSLHSVEYIFVPVKSVTNDMKKKMQEYKITMTTTLLDRLILTKNESHSEQLQQAYFLHGMSFCGH